MEKPASSLPLNVCHVKKKELIINRLHFFFHGTAILSLFYYRITSLHQIITQNDNTSPFLPHFLIFISELTLSFLWFLNMSTKWRPVTRTVYPERLNRDQKQLPSIDVFVCTADPNKEPGLGVMNTVISALALDYPPDKLCVYLSDDGGSSVTNRALKQAWKFSRFWIPFCRKYVVKNGCPGAYFAEEDSDDAGKFATTEFFADKKEIEERYEEFKSTLATIVADRTSVSRDHPPVVEVIREANNKDEEMPRLVYVSREKRPWHHHHFKAGALNTLLRVSSMITNSPYILMLDCDMYCNDRSSARQAMCFHLDPHLSPNLAFVQFPQKFHNISDSDIYDGQIRYVWPKWKGLDGLRGPILSGACLYIKREALYGTRKFQQDLDLVQLKNTFGSSNGFIESFHKNYEPNYANNTKEVQLLASCTYDDDTKWGKEVGFRYTTVVEDYFTGFLLHCEGWISVYYEPSRPCFLGASPISLGEILIQHTRWHVGLNQVGLSRFSPLLYGSLRMSIWQSMCYAEFAHNAFYFVPYYVLGIVPQFCLLRGIPLYPEVSSPYFLVFSLVFLSAQLKNVQEIFSTGHSIRTWLVEQRIWMMRSLTAYLYATLECTLDILGLRKASFLPTNKVVDEGHEKRYQMGVYDFQAPALFMVPLCSLYILNAASFILGFVKMLQEQEGSEMVMQALIPLFVMVLQFPVLEGMVLRRDKGRVSPSVSVVSIVISAIVLSFACCYGGLA